MRKYVVDAAFNSSKFMQYFDQQNSNHGIYNCESFPESKFDAKVKLTTQQVRVFKSNRISAKIKHSNKHNTFQNKLITKNHRIQTK